MAKDVGISPGDVFGRLKVIEKVEDKIEKNGKHRSQYLCECSCEAHTRVVTTGTALKVGTKQSCGCLAKESASKVGKANRTDGISGTPVAQAYYNMKNRCNNVSYGEYDKCGGRGITMCPQWADPNTGVKQFYDDMNPTYFPGASLDRIDVNGNYSPENCRWATRAIQANNMSTNNMVTVEGTTYTATEWNRAMGYSKDKVLNRLHAGWTHEEAVFGKCSETHGSKSMMHNAIYFVDKFDHPCIDQEYWRQGDFDDSEIQKLK